MSWLDSTSPSGKGARRWAVALWVCAALVRAGSIHQTTLGSGEIGGDAIFYYQSAANLAAQGILMDDAGLRALRMPLYPLFLAAVFRCLGSSVLAAQTAQVFLGSLTCVWIYWGALAWLSPSMALLAGWASVFYFGLVFPCGRILAECLYAFLLAAFFAGWFRWRQKGWYFWLMAGAAAGLYWTRPEGILVGLCVGLAAPWIRRGWSRSHSIFMLASLSLAVGLWGLRNEHALGKFIYGTTGSGFSLWAALPRTLHENLGSSLGARPQEAPGLDEIARNRFYRRQATQDLSQAPPFALAKAALFNFLSQFYPFLPEYDLSYALLLPFWLSAFWTLRQKAELWPLFFLIVAWSLIYTVFGGADSRFRQAYAPLLIWLAAGGIAELKKRVPAPKFYGFIGGWAALNVLIFLFWPQARGLVLALKRYCL